MLHKLLLIVLLAVSSVLMNQQYILNEVSLFNNLIEV